MPDLEHQIEFCRQAEETGITGLLTDIGAAKPDPILLAAGLGFILSGWLKLDEMILFGKEVLPGVREFESRLCLDAVPGTGQ